MQKRVYNIFKITVVKKKGAINVVLSNLRVILSERKLTAAKVSYDTGISRPTLTALTAGNGTGVQFSTINRLCNYLRVTPNDLFVYTPYDFNFTPTPKKYIDFPDRYNEFYFHYVIFLKHYCKTPLGPFPIVYQCKEVSDYSKKSKNENEKLNNTFEVTAFWDFSDEDIDKVDKEDVDLCKKLQDVYYKEIPTLCKNYIEGYMLDKIYGQLFTELQNKKISLFCVSIIPESFALPS